ncbi:MAG: poly-beta-1,6-N-acetyl-D-glucosamine biosynthesis protein PgaD [Deltaproteobacteria bacterium]|nr:poly-beta-1,6-N-acetyl-D-glucosamine biosynthesis protein PgaD [Deltaproteobacteria bacterium]
MMKETDGLIIDVPYKLSHLRRSTERLLTILATIVWLVALRPLLAIGLWYVGWDLAYLHMVELEGFNNLAYFALLGALGLTITLSLFSWSRYNSYRFGGLDRRKHRGHVADEEMAAFFCLSATAMPHLQQTANITVNRTERTHIKIICNNGISVSGYHEPSGPRLKR